MMIVSTQELRRQLAFTDDVGNEDDGLLAWKIQAAQQHVERLLGFKLADRYENTLLVPAPLKEAVLQLAGHWYEHREGVTESLREVPYGVSAIVAEFREFTF
jgi:hypothetical protein